jgi:hypothetical protein
MSFSVPYRRILNRMHYYEYQDRLIHNHLNQAGGWEYHQERCRNFIIKALELYKPVNVSVLGSGWLLDLPFAEMIERTEEIYLVDIVHPPDVISQAGTFSNVKLIQQDITGGLIEKVWQKKRKFSFLNKLRSLEDIEVPDYRPDYDPGMVISLNILTQLESLIVDFLKKGSKLEEKDINIFRYEIQKKHMDYLRKHKSVLISDINEIFTDESGNVNCVPTALAELPGGKYKEEWNWHFDIVRPDFYTKKSIFNVVGIII